VMFQKKYEKKLSNGSKREELYEALLNGLTEVEATQTPILWIASYGGKKLGPSEEEIRTLTGVEEPDKYVQGFSLPGCRDWAMKNWEKVIPFAKEIFLRWAKGRDNTQFLEALEIFEG
jgi:hypothetical protein